MRHELEVNRAELVEGLEKLRKLVKKPKPHMEAVFSFEEGNLVVFLNGVSIFASAEGSLPGMARISGIRAISLSKAIPTDDPLTVALEEGRLSFGSLSIPCTWHDVEPNPIQLPIDPPLTVMLGVRMKYSEDEIFKSGLSKPVGEAEAQRNMLIRRAANALEPLGVHISDVERLVDDTLRRINNL